MATPNPAKYKEVVIIGNGPSAITLSYFLSGNWPYYSALCHSIDFLHYRLAECGFEDKSLVEQNLSILSEGLEGRSQNPVSVLFDVLNHPEADLGLESPSALTWKHHPQREVEHVVLGMGSTGGAWQKMEGGILTISLGSWMELPNYTFRDWDAARQREGDRQPCLRQNRATVRSVAQYYRNYVEVKKLSRFFVTRAFVTSVRLLDQNALEETDIPQQRKNVPLWVVTGCDNDSHSSSFSFITPHVVLATGNSDQENRLGVPGEDLPFVLHSLSHLEKLILTGELSARHGKLLVVGAGLSAADAIIAAYFHAIPTIHVFRRAVDDRELIFNKLPQNMYPEYHKVYQMMQNCSGECYEGYKSFPQTTVIDIHPNKTVTLALAGRGGSHRCIQVSHVLVLIGMHPDLSFLPMGGYNLGIHPEKHVDCKYNPVAIDPYSFQSVSFPGLFALGPLVGDNFVRFVQGGALAITNYLWQKKSESQFAQ